MKFLCLLYNDEDERDTIPDEEWQALMRTSFALVDRMRADGVSLGGAALQPARTASMIRKKRGDRSFTDGPYIETKEQLAGYLLIEAPDMEAAKEIALSLPVGVLGTMELRPVWEREDLLMRKVAASEGTEKSRLVLF